MVIATAQQTLTEDNRQAQLNSNELFRLNDRFPVKVDIEANDIKEIITKRLLGKSKDGNPTDYEQACENGFTGTFIEWIVSLSSEQLY